MKRASNENEICFIICSNNTIYTKECIYYINHLNIPEGFRIDVLTVEDAVSMTAGYNAAMQSSQAKYKIYLHQDTFIVNPDFIQDFLNVFRQDEKIGMIGMVGSPMLPQSGIMWEGQRCGAIYSGNIVETIEFRQGINTLTEVEAVDGLLMITQYDIPWREDLFDKWDFYDCSQSFEFIRQGYKVVVPAMDQPWCLHDSGPAGLKNYETERWKFLQEYYYERRNPVRVESVEKVTAVVTSCNRKEILQNTIKLLEKMPGIANIIIVDNGSGDMTSEWLSEQPYEFIHFDEGVQGYGRVWNTVVENFYTEDRIVFMEAGVCFDESCLAEMMEALRMESVGIVYPVTNHYFGMEYETGISCEVKYRKTLAVNWTMWAVSRDMIVRNGYFSEELMHPKNVLVDYSLRLLKQGIYQLRCLRGYAHDNLGKPDDVYPEAAIWEREDRVSLKKIWRMNYFNLISNFRLISFIQEEREKEFKVLEVGCDLGATLLEIQNQYPNCKVCGQDINEEAISIAKHIADVRYGNIDELQIPFDGKFDYIIFGDVLEHLRDPAKVIKMCRNYLNDGGFILASVPNIMHMSVLEELIDGRFTYRDTGILDRTHIHFFTWYELTEMFISAGYMAVDVKTTNTVLSPRQKELRDILLRLSDKTKPWMFETIQYVVKVKVNENESAMQVK